MLTGTPVMRGVHGGNIKGYIDIVRITKNIYEASDAEYWMDPEYLPIGLSGDFGAFNNQPEPRFTEQLDGQMVSLYGDDDYPYDAFEPADHDNPEGALTGVFDKQKTGTRTFNYNTDGLAHYGLVPDMLADVRSILDEKRK